MGTMARKEIYFPFEVYIQFVGLEINKERDILILVGAMLKVTCVLTEKKTHTKGKFWYISTHTTRICGRYLSPGKNRDSMRYLLAMRGYCEWYQHPEKSMVLVNPRNGIGWRISSNFLGHFCYWVTVVKIQF